MEPLTLDILLVIFWGFHFFAAIIIAPFIWLWRALGGNLQLTTKMALGALACSIGDAPRFPGCRLSYRD